MRVGELIEELQKFDPLTAVRVAGRDDESKFVPVESVRRLFASSGGDMGLPGDGYHIPGPSCIAIVPVETYGEDVD